MPRRIQRRRTKGWRMPEGAVYVGRPTKWGNPFVVGLHGTLAECIYLHRALIEGYLGLIPMREPWPGQIAILRASRGVVAELRGKDLACWCRPGASCHADVLLEIANSEGEA